MSLKTIQTQAIIEGIRARKDRSLGLTISTPELTPQEKVVFIELQNMAVELTIKPVDEVSAPQVVIDKDMQQKSQSARIRNTLYILFSQDAEGFSDFELYYRAKTEKYLEFLKSKIEESY